MTVSAQDFHITLDGIGADFDLPIDAAAFLAIRHAIHAYDEGNFPIGAVLMDGEGQIMLEGHNHVFHPHFRSDRHAEMVVITEFEERYHSLSTRFTAQPYHLITSLEPCPMCLSRILSSKITHVTYISDDPNGGMVHLADKLPPVWQTFLDEMNIQKYSGIQQFDALSRQLLKESLDPLNQKIIKK